MPPEFAQIEMPAFLFVDAELRVVCVQEALYIPLTLVFVELNMNCSLLHLLFSAHIWLHWFKLYLLWMQHFYIYVLPL